MSAIGAIGEATLGYFDTNVKQYFTHQYAGIYEIANMSGNISTQDGKPYLHIHAVLAGEDGTAFGGHLSRSRQRHLRSAHPRIDGHVGRSFSEEIGLNLVTFSG